MHPSLPHDQDCHEMWSKKRKKVLRDQQREAAAKEVQAQATRNGCSTTSANRIHDLYTTLSALQARQPAQQLTPNLIATSLNIRNDETNFYAITKIGSQLLVNSSSASSHLKDKLKTMISNLCTNSKSNCESGKSNSQIAFENGSAASIKR